MESTATTMDGIFRTVPAAAFPPTVTEPVAYIEVDGQPQWIIREGADLCDVVAELDRIASHLVRHGIWRLAGDSDQKPPSPRLRHVS